jgi:hypothetical protein
MGRHYSQRDIDERYALYRLHEAGTVPRKIAILMGRSASTISHELKHNALPKGGYKPGSADRIALSRCRVRPEKLYRYLPRARASRGEGQSWRRPVVGDVISSAAVSRSKTGGLFINAPKPLKTDKNLGTERKT